MLLLVLVFIVLLGCNAQPNIVLILTDDQDLMLGGLNPMAKTRKIMENGANFKNAFATTPVCCPSRSSILTGNYIHTHQTVNNSYIGGCSNSDWQQNWEPKTYNTYLHDNNYRTFFGGKYLNEYGFDRAGGVEHIPPGWDWWVGLVGNSVYYNYTLSVNGSASVHKDQPEDYLTDVLKDWALEFLKVSSEQPFLLVVCPPSAHEPFTPAIRHKGTYDGVNAPRTPNFNSIPNAESKHWLLRLEPHILPDDIIERIDNSFRGRWETLLAVDELIDSIYQQLVKSEQLNNTIIILTSDHGFHLGQFAQTWDKRQPYDTDVRIPLLVSGAGVQKNAIFNPVLTIDFAPTLMDIAGVQNKPKMDGESFAALLAPQDSQLKYDRSFTIEYNGEGSKHDTCGGDPNTILCRPELACKCFDSKNNTYTCVRRLSNSIDSVFCTFQDDENFVEEYDLSKDPYQLNNIAYMGL